MSEGKYYVRNPDVVLREEDEDGALLFNPDTNQIRVINPSGLLIWKMCDGKNDMDGFIAAIKETFEQVPDETVSRDVEVFINGMFETGFVGTVENQ